jgi:hypothetical protein
MNFKWGLWKLTFGAINSCFLKIFLYALIQLLSNVIVVHFECYVRPFAERGLACCTKASVFSTTLGPILQTGLVTLWYNVWEVMNKFQSQCWAICLESSGLQAIYSRHWCEANCHLLIQGTSLFFPHLDVLVPLWGTYSSGVYRLLPMCHIRIAVGMEFSTIRVCVPCYFEYTFTTID